MKRKSIKAKWLAERKIAKQRQKPGNRVQPMGHGPRLVRAGGSRGGGRR
jgi:hypothetical protein